MTDVADRKEKIKTGIQATEITNALICEYLNQKNAGLKKAAMRLAQGLNAKETKAFNNEGKIVYSKPMVDFKTRFNYAKYVTQLFNAEPPRQSEISGPKGGPIRTEDATTKDRVLKFFEELKLRDG